MYMFATVFIAHYSDISNVCIQHDNTSAETLRAKIAFERFAKSCGINNQNYHANNGWIVDNDFINDIKLQDKLYPNSE